MYQLKKVKSVILGVQDTQLPSSSHLERHFKNAVCQTAMWHLPKGYDVEGAYDVFSKNRCSIVRAFSELAKVSQDRLHKDIYERFQHSGFNLPIQHIKHDSKLFKATERLRKKVQFATLSEMNRDIILRFYQEMGLSRIHPEQSIFAHEDIDFANKSSYEAFDGPLNYLGYSDEDDLSSVLFIDADKDHIDCAQDMGMQVAHICGVDDPKNYQYANVKNALHQLHKAKSGQPESSFYSVWSSLSF